MPLSKAGEWSDKVITGELLDPSVPTLCLCKAGVRSMRVATFLATHAGFTDVYNVEGGITAYAERVDRSIGFY